MFVTRKNTETSWLRIVYDLVFCGILWRCREITCLEMNRKKNTTSFAFTFQAYDITQATRAIHSIVVVVADFLSFSFFWRGATQCWKRKYRMRYYYCWCNWRFFSAAVEISFVLWNTRIRLFSRRQWKKKYHSSVEWCTVGYRNSYNLRVYASHRLIVLIAEAAQSRAWFFWWSHKHWSRSIR